MSRRIFAITTHHEHSEEAAEEWKVLGVCAIGWSRINFSKCRSMEEIRKRLRREGYDPRHANEIWCYQKEISKGDIILAYSGKNTISYIGESTGKHVFNQTNTIGDPEGRYRYSNQMEVKWRDEPHHFDRWDLPEYLATQFGKRGVTVAEIDPGSKGFEGFIAIVKTCARSGSRLPGTNEEMVKTGIIKYLHHSLDGLESGLRIERAEFPIGKQERPDFIAKDKRGRIVLIECKGNAGADAIDQIRRYEKEFSKDKKPRLMVVAFRTNEACRLAAKKAGNVELFECDLKYVRVVV